MLITSVLATAAPSLESPMPPAPLPQQPFASMLRQSQAAKPALQAPPRQAPLSSQPQGAEPAKRPEPAKAAAPQAQANTNEAEARAANRTEAARSADADNSQEDETEGERTEARVAKPAKTGDEVAAPADALAQWLLGLQPQAGASGLAWPGGRGPGAADGANEAADASDTADAFETGDAAGRQRLRALGRGDEASRRIDASQQEAADRAANGADAKLPHLAAGTDATAAFAPFERPERLFKLGAPEAVHGGALVGVATPASSSATTASPAAIHLPTPLEAPDFAHALGAQLSVLAKDGVQRAELHLNPAEMGPVSVHIVMAGSHARVDFGADLAATRQILEAGLPELAGALREAGLTLTGGGVSQHSNPRGDGEAPEAGDNGRDNGGRDTSGAADAARPLRRIVSAGGVDLYA